MSEKPIKVLRNRRKKQDRGRVLRVSTEVYKFLNDKRLNRKKRSWDSMFRSMLGLPDRKGIKNPLVSGWLEVTTGKFYLKQSEANGQSVLEAAKRGRKLPHKPIKLKEERW